MRVLISPDKFKGSLDAKSVCDAIARGLKTFSTDIAWIAHPLADGGEGTLDILEQVLDVKRIILTVQDPQFRPIEAYYLRTEKEAFIEMAMASGLELLTKDERNCMHMTTWGTGELIRHAIQSGVKEVFLFIGGSATNDAGIGIAAALGYQFLDANDREVKPVGNELLKISKIDVDQVDPLIQDVSFKVICDVKNPLYGRNGAAYVYGPQKGANAREVKLLDDGLRNIAQVIEGHLARPIAHIPGSGAAGGVGGGAVAFLGAEILPGIESIMEITSFDQQLENIDLIITGEGKLDHQTLQGKVVAGVAEKAGTRNIPVSIICGIAENSEMIQKELKVQGIYPIKTDNITTEDAMQNAAQHVVDRTYEAMQDFVKKMDK
ncbi:MAG: glycerate kinase [Cyclobacteriaceae bacterium]|nr:glycerate kinase [Cyclobacteriaceae bacterium HetDA_MAG_MS6]